MIFILVIIVALLSGILGVSIWATLKLAESKPASQVQFVVRDDHMGLTDFKVEAAPHPVDKSNNEAFGGSAGCGKTVLHYEDIKKELKDYDE